MRTTATYRLVSVVLLSGLSCAAMAPRREPFPTSLGVVEAQPVAPEVDAIASEIGSYQTRLSEREVRAVARTILECSQRYGFDRDLLLGVIRVESAFNNFARSDKGALGLMQVLPTTGEAVARDLGIEWRGPRTLFDPVQNVRIGSAYLAWLHARYQNLDRALAAYNWGPGAIDRRLSNGHPVPVEYVSSVLTASQTRFTP